MVSIRDTSIIHTNGGSRYEVVFFSQWMVLKTIAAVLFRSLIAFSASLFFSFRSTLLLSNAFILSFAASIRSKRSLRRSNSSSNLRSANAFLFFFSASTPPLLLPLLLFFFYDFKNVSSSTKPYFKASSDVAIPCLDCISIVKCTFSYSCLLYTSPSPRDRG